MHPIISEQIARSRMEELQRQATIARRRRQSVLARRRRQIIRGGGGWRVRLAARILRLARVLDRDGRVVPAAARR